MSIILTSFSSPHFPISPAFSPLVPDTTVREEEEDRHENETHGKRDREETNTSSHRSVRKGRGKRWFELTDEHGGKLMSNVTSF